VKADGTAGNIYSTGWMSAEGVDATSGGGGGLIQTVYGSSGLGSTYSDTTLTDTFNAYAINSIYNELQEVKAGALTSVSWGIISSKPTTIEGYGITDAKIASGVITLGSNTITPLVSHQSIYALTFAAGTFAADVFTANAAAKTINIPTSSSLPIREQ
jgi:hypothetical protein